MGSSNGMQQASVRARRGFWKDVGHVVVCLVTFGQICGGRNRDKVRPALQCPPDQQKLSDDLQDHATVTWNEPKAIDDRDGEITPTRQGLGPGYIFSEGITVIGYYARDNSGNMARCTFKINITVPRCRNLGALKDGYSICHTSFDMRKGTVCQFGCYDGHTLVGSSSTMCTQHGTWTTGLPKCDRTTCDPPLTATGEASVQCSDNNFYRSKCSYICAEGFDVTPGMTRVRVCTVHGTWRGKEPKCTDITRPLIRNCTGAVYGFAERGSTTGCLHWTEPSVFDNADKSIRLSRTGPSSDARLTAGTYDVKYNAEDESGNKAIQCTMKIIVKVLRCPTVYSLPRQTVHCPNGFIYGSYCNFKCANGSLINGTEIATCEKGSTGQYASWRWGNTQPFCQAVQLCEDNVLPPDYGAIACDYWLGGKFCQMLCKKGYDIPPGYTFPEMIVCSETGQWLPTSTLPDCAKTFSSQASSLAMDVHYYFEGDCSDANVLTSIKEKFIQALMTSTFRDACEVYTEKCYPGNVQVQCGSLSGKRSLSLNVKFDMKIVGKSSFGNMSFGRLNENIMKAINKHMNNDTFELLDLPNNETMKVQDFSHDSLRIVCNERMIPSYSSESCIECPPGTFYDRDTQSCPMCPVGEFQPSAASSACIHCPTEQTTRQQGATSINECEDACSPGTFSYNGLPPCTPCPVGMYVDTYGTATCRVCPASSTTIAEGTHLKSDCKEFDIVFTSPAGKVVMPFKNASIDEQHIFAISFWINSPNHKLTGSIIQLNFPNSKEPFDISIDNDRLAVTGKGVTVSTTFMVNDTLWHSIVLHVEESTVEIYNGGAKSSIQYRSQASMAIKNIQEPYVVISDGDFIGSISHLNVWSKGMKLENILEINSRCDIVYHGDLLAWKEFESVDGDDVFVQIPSECDDQNDCDVNSCNGGICKDELHAYSCVCPVGLSGDKCEINIDDCVDNACENNSTCVDGIGEYTCQCGIHFKGDLCEIAMVDGDWSVWSNWSVCSASCGNGTTVRKRLCNNPTPDHGGKDCVGENTDIMICNVENCTVCTNLTTPSNSILFCNWETAMDAVYCTLTCEDGYDFDHAAKEDYHCGPDTFHLWDFQTDDNPYGRLPACTKKTDGRRIEWKYMASYEQLICDNKDTSELIAKKIKTAVYEGTDTLTCQQDGSCSLLNIEVRDCQVDRFKRSTNPLTAGFAADFTCDAVKFTSDGCRDIINEALEEILHKIDNLFNTFVNGQEYFIKKNSSAFGGRVYCNVGMVPVYHYCVPCSAGRYQRLGKCDKCDVGTYQQSTGQTSCVSCPVELTTEGRASTSVADCKVHVDTSANNISVWTHALPIIIGVTFGICCVVTSLLIRRKCRTVKKERKIRDMFAQYGEHKHCVTKPKLTYLQNKTKHKLEDEIPLSISNKMENCSKPPLQQQKTFKIDIK